MLKKHQKEKISERKDPGDPENEFCTPGSIEQELDMCEEGSLRGDDILHSHGLQENDSTEENKDLNEMIDQYHADLSEENREGDEMSGDEHSSGFQGGDPETTSQPNLDNGLPGDRARRIESLEQSDYLAAEEEEEGLVLRPREAPTKRPGKPRSHPKRRQAS